MKIIDKRFAVLYKARTEPVSIIIIPPRALMENTGGNVAPAARLEDCVSYRGITSDMFVRVPAGSRIGAISDSGRVPIFKLGLDGVINIGEIDVIGDDSFATYAVTAPAEPGDVYEIQ